MGDNTNAPRGFEPLELGSKYRAHLYRITNNYGTALYLNDPVYVVTAGTIEICVVTKAYPVLGSIVGIFKQDGPTSHRPENLIPIEAANGMPYLAASIGATYDYWALVADDPDQIFLVQEDSDTTPLEYTHVGANCQHVASSGSTVTGISNTTLDSSSANSGADLQWRLMQPAPIWDMLANQWNTVYDGATASAYTKWIVRCNLHQLGRTTSGLA